MILYKICRKHIPRIMTGIIILILLIMNASAVPYKEWSKTYPCYGSTDCTITYTYAHQTSDGGYIVLGNVLSGRYDYNGILFKTDIRGNMLWNKTFSEGYFSAVQQTSDKGYILAGNVHNLYTGNFDAWLIKTDINGSEQWNKTFRNFGMNFDVHGIQQTIDGGYIFTGSSDIGILIKTDINGDEEWNKIYHCYNLVGQQTLDRGYILSCENIDKGNTMLIKTGVNGNRQWDKTYNFDGMQSVQQASDGGYILLGTYPYGISMDGSWFIKTDNNGNQQWEKTFGNQNNRISSVQQTLGGGYILAGWDNAQLIKIGANGDKQWDKTFGIAYYNNVQQTADRGYILAGLGGDGILLVKVSGDSGDVNDDGIITVADALLYLRFVIGQDISPYHMSTNDDVTCDGNIRIDDILKVLRKAVGQNVNLVC